VLRGSISTADRIKIEQRARGFSPNSPWRPTIIGTACTVIELCSRPLVASGAGSKGSPVARSRQTDAAFYVDYWGDDGLAQEAPQQHDDDAVWKLGFSLSFCKTNCTRTRLFIAFLGRKITYALRILSLTDLKSLEIESTCILFGSIGENFLPFFSHRRLATRGGWRSVLGCCWPSQQAGLPLALGHALVRARQAAGPVRGFDPRIAGKWRYATNNYIIS
jgi:hypothetical protein